MNTGTLQAARYPTCLIIENCGISLGYFVYILISYTDKEVTEIMDKAFDRKEKQRWLVWTIEVTKLQIKVCKYRW